MPGVPHIVLIHGAWHGGWCWDKVIPLLEKNGHGVSAPDLPGHGNDPTPAADVTLDRYVEAVISTIAKATEPVILVGHSMAGIVISQVAEEIPDKIQQLVYLTAFLPRNGESLSSLERRNPEPRVPQLLVVAADGATATLVPEAIPNLFYHDCSDADVETALAHLCPQPLSLLETPVKISDSRFGKVSRCYIKCSQDRALAPEFQDRMINSSPGTVTYELPASHSPFYSMPSELALLLMELAGS